MTFSFRAKNLGPLDIADIEISNLTIITGGNNSGKTYLTYSIYALLRNWRRYATSSPVPMKLGRDLRAQGFGEVRFDAIPIAEIIASIEEHLKSDIANVFSASSERFSDTLFALKLEIPKWEDIVPKFTRRTSAYSLTGSKDTSNRLLKIELEKKNEDGSGPSSRAVSTFLIEWIFSGVFPRPYISTSERLGIALFYKDLDVNRNALVEQLLEMGARKENSARLAFDPFDYLEKATARFALPIRSNIDFVRGVDQVQKGATPLSLEMRPFVFRYISAMLGGSYKFKIDDIYFSNGRVKRKLNIPIYLGSSSVRSLADLNFYLLHSVRAGDLLMIDEPESHLTPQNQIIVARLLAYCVKKGLKVFITTHSDYIIKELNNLIMLWGLPKDRRSKFMHRSSKMIASKYLEEELLDPVDIRAYVCSKNSTTLATIDRYGIEIKSMDDAINQINEVAEELSTLVDAAN